MTLQKHRIVELAFAFAIAAAAGCGSGGGGSTAGGSQSAQPSPANSSAIASAAPTSPSPVASVAPIASPGGSVTRWLQTLDQQGDSGIVGWLVSDPSAAHNGQFYNCEANTYIALLDPHQIATLGRTSCFEGTEVYAEAIKLKPEYPSSDPLRVAKLMLKSGPLDEAALTQALGVKQSTNPKQVTQTWILLNNSRARLQSSPAVKLPRSIQPRPISTRQ